jgi:biotin transport system substrate-specific component
MNQETKTNKTGFTTKSITMMALFAAILCISAYISIPLPIPGSPHITLLNFVIIVIALLFPLSQSFITILVWMALGAIGLPVFIGGGSGIGYLTIFSVDTHSLS